MYKELDIIQSAGVEVRGLKTSAIARRKVLTKPVLEKYVLTPNVEPAHLDLHSALRVCTHIVLENKPGIHVKVVELYSQGTAPLSPAVALILADWPLIKASVMQCHITILFRDKNMLTSPGKCCLKSVHVIVRRCSRIFS
jgi:fatty acid synthase